MKNLSDNHLKKLGFTWLIHLNFYFSAKQWNALPDFFRTSFFADFKTKIQDVTFM